MSLIVNDFDDTCGHEYGLVPGPAPTTVYAPTTVFATAPAAASIGSQKRSAPAAPQQQQQQQQSSKIGADSNRVVEEYLRRTTMEQAGKTYDAATLAKHGNAVLNGGSTASKVVCFSAQPTIGELNEGFSILFNREQAEPVFKVHARNSENRALRVGQIDQVAVTQITLLGAYNGLCDVPISVRSDFGGKIYMMPFGTGRAGGRENRALAIIPPGYTSTECVVYRNIREDILKLARLTGQFDVTSLRNEMIPFHVEGNENWLVPNKHFVTKFIMDHAEEWSLPDHYYDDVRKTHRLFPGTLIEFVFGLLSKLDADVRKNKHDLGSLSFTLQTLTSPQSMSSQYLAANTQISFYMTFLIEYQFLHPHLLLVSAAETANK